MSRTLPDRPFALLTVEQAAEYLLVSKSLVQHLSAARQITFTRLGRKTYFQQSDLDEYSGRQRVEAVYNPSLSDMEKWDSERIALQKQIIQLSNELIKMRARIDTIEEKMSRRSLFRKLTVWIKVLKKKEKP